MKVVPQAGQSSASDNSQPSQSAQSARERAIARLTGNQAGTPPPPQPKSAADLPSASNSEPEVMPIPKLGPETTIEAAAPEQQPAPASAATTPEKPPLSAQYAQLARREKALRAQAQKLKAEQEAFKRQRDEAAKPAPAPVETAEAYRARLLKAPLETLNEAGLTWDQLTQQALNAPSPEQRAQQEYIAKLEARLASLEDGVKTNKQLFEENQQQAYKQAVNQIRTEAKHLVYTDPAYETIKETNSVNDVVELIERTFKEEQVLLSVEEAAQAVEDHLIEEAMKITKIKKIQDRLKPASSPAPQQQPRATQQPPQTMKTLTNAAGASRKLSTRERAILAFKGELKN